MQYMFGSSKIKLIWNKWKCVSINKMLTLINHNCDRRKSRKIHHWINNLSEYDYLSHRDFLWRLPQRPVEGCWEKIRILCKLGFLMTSLVVVDNILFCYLSLVALAIVHLVGDNREFDV